MSQNASPRLKMRRIDIDTSIKNPSLVEILDRYKAQKLKNRELAERAGSNNNSEYARFLKRQNQYRVYQRNIDDRIDTEKKGQAKKDKENSVLVQKKRKRVHQNRRELEEMGEKNRIQNYRKQQQKIQKYSQTHQSQLKESHFSRSNSNLESSLRIRAHKQLNQSQFSKNAMLNSMVKQERVRLYLKCKQSVQSEHLGKKDRSVESVLERSGKIESGKLAYYVQKHLEVGKNQEQNYRSEKQKKIKNLSKQRKEYQKRKERAWEKKREYLEQKSNRAEEEFQHSNGKFQKVERNRRSIQICHNKHVEEHRKKIERILLRNEALKNQERQRKEKLVEIHRKKIEDIDKFKREFDRLKMEIGTTFVTS